MQRGARQIDGDSLAHQAAGRLGVQHGHRAPEQNEAESEGSIAAADRPGVAEGDATGTETDYADRVPAARAVEGATDPTAQRQRAGAVRTDLQSEGRHVDVSRRAGHLS